MVDGALVECLFVIIADIQVIQVESSLGEICREFHDLAHVYSELAERVGTVGLIAWDSCEAVSAEITPGFCKRCPCGSGEAVSCNSFL